MGGFSSVVGLSKVIADALYDAINAATNAINGHKNITTGVHGAGASTIETIAGTATHASTAVSASVHANAIRLNAANTGRLNIGALAQITKLSVKPVSLEATLTGTLAITQNSAIVTGTDTLFLTELFPGDNINFIDLTKTVLSVETNTSLTLTANLLAGNVSGMTGYCDSIIFDAKKIDGAQAVSIFKSGSIGIGITRPNANALLDVVSTTKAVMFPRMTTAERDAIAAPAEGMLIYNLTTHVFNFYAAAAWGAI